MRSNALCPGRVGRCVSVVRICAWTIMLRFPPSNEHTSLPHPQHCACFSSCEARRIGGFKGGYQSKAYTVRSAEGRLVEMTLSCDA
jgi:hypothetical protein